jgi:lipopolysaccharide transport system ATP-binding protein
MSRVEVKSKMKEIVEFSELGDFIDQPIRVYSSGMLARLGFSVVSCLDPEILLIDEILAVGDMEFQKKCIDKMTGFKKSGVTIIFVSHSMPDVKRICDRVAWIDNHTIKKIGSTEAVVLSYARQ